MHLHLKCNATTVCAIKECALSTTSCEYWYLKNTYNLLIRNERKAASGKRHCLSLLTLQSPRFSRTHPNRFFGLSNIFFWASSDGRPGALSGHAKNWELGISSLSAETNYSWLTRALVPARKVGMGARRLSGCLEKISPTCANWLNWSVSICCVTSSIPNSLWPSEKALHFWCLLRAL